MAYMQGDRGRAQLHCEAICKAAPLDNVAKVYRTRVQPTPANAAHARRPVSRVFDRGLRYARAPRGIARKPP